ncbi:hypothetical protein SESBI_20156 [Sesbania bispinosa]|nr:hypothetical protein SESBI_20156 [Sesbania bispinosa]
MGSRGCIAYTPVIALRQLKWTQVVPDKELLGGVCFQYGMNNKQHGRVRRAWEHIHKKRERDLGRARVSVSTEYLEWRNERRAYDIPVPMERNECVDANTRLAQRSRSWKEKEVENLSTEVKKMQDKVKILEEEIAKVQTEKEDLEIKGQEKDQVIEQMQAHLQQAQAEAQMIEQLKEDLQQAQAKAESHKSLARDYSIELMKTKKNENLLEGQIKKLEIERDYLHREIKKLEPVEQQKDIWKVRAEHEQEQRKKLMKTCERMAEITQDHVTTLTTLVHEATEEIDSNPGIKLPWKIFKLVKFCKDISRSFRGN